MKSTVHIAMFSYHEIHHPSMGNVITNGQNPVFTKYIRKFGLFYAGLILDILLVIIFTSLLNVVACILSVDDLMITVL